MFCSELCWFLPEFKSLFWAHWFETRFLLPSFRYFDFYDPLLDYSLTKTAIPIKFPSLKLSAEFNLESGFENLRSSQNVFALKSPNPRSVIGFENFYLWAFHQFLWFFLPKSLFPSVFPLKLFHFVSRHQFGMHLCFDEDFLVSSGHCQLVQGKRFADFQGILWGFSFLFEDC